MSGTTLTYMDEQIRQKILSILIGNTPAGDKVLLRPSFALSASDMPCITVNAMNINIETLTLGSNRTQRRTALFPIGIFVSAADDAESLANTILLAVEQTMAADRTLGRLVSNCVPVNIKRDLLRPDGTADLFFVATLTFQVTYNTLEGAPTSPR